MIKKGKRMEMMILIFIGCVSVMFGSMWLYNKKEDTAFNEMLLKYQAVQMELKSAKDSIDAQRTTIMIQNTKIKEFEEKITCATQKLEKFKVDVDDLQEHCAKIRDQQIMLKDQLSNKRPIVKITTPIPVELQGATVKPDQKLVNKIKKQLKELSNDTR